MKIVLPVNALRVMFLLSASIILFMLNCVTPMKSKFLKAFPGAEGFGAETTGGRGGRIVKVKNLDDSGPGSLRAALNLLGPRIIVFEVGGTVELSTDLVINEPYITIAGQTAPSPGITLKDAGLRIKSHDVILQHVRIRVGDKGIGTNPSDTDAINIRGYEAYNIIIDHCSFSWAIDENVSTWDNASLISIQWSIISEGLNRSKHKKGAHSKGSLIGSHNSHSITLHHNLYAHNFGRNPSIKTSGVVDVVNNVFYNWGTSSAGFFEQEYGYLPINYVGNYVKRGYNTPRSAHAVKMYASHSIYDGSTYVSGNIGPHRPDGVGEEYLVVDPESRGWLIATRHPAPQVATTSAKKAYHDVLRFSGARPNDRDAIDERIVEDVKNGSGRIIDSQDVVGGWDSKKESYRPMVSLPDPHGDIDGDGYLKIEEALLNYSKKLVD